MSQTTRDFENLLQEKIDYSLGDLESQDYEFSHIEDFPDDPSSIRIVFRSAMKPEICLLVHIMCKGGANDKK